MQGALGFSFPQGPCSIQVVTVLGTLKVGRILNLEPRILAFDGLCNFIFNLRTVTAITVLISTQLYIPSSIVIIQP